MLRDTQYIVARILAVDMILKSVLIRTKLKVASLGPVVLLFQRVLEIMSNQMTIMLVLSILMSSKLKSITLKTLNN